MPGNASNIPAMENTPMIWLSMSVAMPRSVPINWMAGATLNWLNVAVNPRKNNAAKHTHRSLGLN